MPPTLPLLNESLAYVLCPACRANGNPSVMLARETSAGSKFQFRCPLQHVYTWAQLEAQGADMTHMNDFFHEQPNPEAIKWPIFVMPKIKALLETKFAGRVQTTIATMLDLLADDAVIFIQGSEAKELRKRGIQNGQQLLAHLEALKNLEAERDQAVKELDRVREFLKEAGV